MPTPNIPPGLDFLDPDLNVKGLPIDELAELRSIAPVWWCEQKIGKGGFNDGGYWAVTKHKDVKEVSRRNDIYASGPNTALPQFADDMAREDIDMQSRDPAQHGRRTPRPAASDHLPRVHAARRRAAARRTHPNVPRISPKPPRPQARAISSSRCRASCRCRRSPAFSAFRRRTGTKLFRWTNEMTGNEDPEFAHVDGRTSSMEMLGYAMKMAAMKAKDPGDDIVTALINADIDGEKLTDDEFAFFVLMLAVAGSETTRNSITHGMIAFVDNPDQWDLYKRERPATAADEIVRWATPVTAFQRTAVEDTELAGVQIKAGQRVVMFYRSANFDDEVFEDPHTFNILRDPNPHVGFGGTGVHYCIGANLARMTIDLIFNAIADHMPDLTPVGVPDRLRSGWLNGIKHWQVDYTGSAAS